MLLEGEYAIELFKVNRGAEARELLTKVLGPDFAKEELVFALEQALVLK